MTCGMFLVIRPASVPGRPPPPMPKDTTRGGSAAPHSAHHIPLSPEELLALRQFIDENVATGSFVPRVHPMEPKQSSFITVKKMGY